MKISLRAFAFFSLLLISCSSESNKDILDPIAFSDAIKNNPGILLDVRTAEEFNAGHLDGAINIDWNQGEEVFKSKLEGYNTSDVFYVYCLSGGRSHAARQQLNASGFKHTVELQGGLLAWQQAGMNLGQSKPTQVQRTQQDLLNEIQANTFTIVDFNAVWCGPCKQQKPILESFLKSHPKVKLIELDVDREQQLVQEYEIDAIPRILIYQRGKLIQDFKGLVDAKTLAEVID
jgi:thioredoxin 1